MKQKLLTDIELDVKELKCLMDTLSKGETQDLCELLRRNILQMRGRLDLLLQELDSVPENTSSSPVLGDCIKSSADLRRSISLNDSFRFSRELFGGDSDLMNRVVEQISVMSSLQASVAFLSSKVEVEEENEAMSDLLELLKKYFNQSA